MARPCKSANVISKNLTKEEKEKRIEIEEKLKGNSDKLIAPEYLSSSQKELFYYIKSELEESKILGNLDIYILAKCAIAIDRLQNIEETINKSPNAILNSQFMSSKDKYDKDFYRCCSELSLSPQARAKISNINKNAKDNKDDPVRKALERRKK